MDDRVFEDEVRRIARLMWPAGQFGGASMQDERERDGVFVTEECVHLVECTTSRRKDKAQADIKKLLGLWERMRKKYPDKGVKGWFVTLEDPTAEQMDAAIKGANKVVACSYDHFRSRVVDASAYLEARNGYAFGSSRDPDTDAQEDESPYVPLDIMQVKRAEDRWDVGRIAEGLCGGSRIVLLGDYGAGKSTTLKKVFETMRSQFYRNRSSPFPVLLNLRDHQGQKDAAEAIERHARNVGYAAPSHLVRAWRAGFAVLLLDGLDEVASAGWTGRVRKLRDIRYQAMELIRAFMRQTPDKPGIMLSGRAHFFDSDREMRTAIGDSGPVVYLTLNEFTEDQVATYLAQRGHPTQVPSWLPTRPLLLAYLVARGLFDQGSHVDEDVGPAQGWDMLLHKISAREAEVEAGIEGQTVRRLIERLATKARRGFDGLGPLSQEDILHSFNEICGYPPDDRALKLLQRLPGLGRHERQEDGSRVLVDADFADAARAGDVLAYLSDPYGSDLGDASWWHCGLGRLGTGVAIHRIRDAEYGAAKISTAINKAAMSETLGPLCADLVGILNAMSLDYTMGAVYVRDAMFDHLEFHEASGDLSRIELQDCIVRNMEIEGPVEASRMPNFRRCYFGSVAGRAGNADMPMERFREDCVFEMFEGGTQTTAAILHLDLPMGTRVMLTVLRKLYLQAGRGRMESALHRGLDHRGRRLVPDVLELIRREGLAVRARGYDDPVWLPVRAQSTRARRMINAPTGTHDPALDASAQVD